MKKVAAAAILAFSTLPLAAAPAGATAIIPQGVGVRVTDNALGFVEKEIEGRQLSIQKDNIKKAPMSCFDEVGMNNLTVNTTVNHATLDWDGATGGLALTVYLDELDMAGTLYGKDSNFFDLCPTFSLGVNDMKMTNVVFTAEVTPHVDSAYNLTVTIDGTPSMSFDNLSMDLSGFPQWLVDLVLSPDFVQNFIQSETNKLMAAEAPNLVKTATFKAMFTGYAGPFTYAIGASQIAIDDHGADAMFDTQVAFPGTAPACVPAYQTPTFNVTGDSGLGAYGDTSMVELSVADAAVNQILYAAWQGGMMCYDSDTKPLDAFTHVLQGLAPQAGQLLKYQVSVAQPPTVAFTDGKMEADVMGFHLEAWALDPNSGDMKVLIDADANLSVGLSVDVDRNTNELLVSLDGSQITFQTLTSQVLFSNSPTASDDLKQFISGWVMQKLNEQIHDKAVTPTILPQGQFIVMLDSMNLRQGHLVAGASAYDANDPAVDNVPPSTTILTHLGQVRSTAVNVEYAGTDDRAGELVYSWKVDDGGWSTWTPDDHVTLQALPDGPHVFSVKARDAWHNEDPNPPTMQFDVAAVDSGKKNGVFGCDVADAGANAPAGLVMSLLGAAALGMGLLRRRKA